MIEGHAQPFTLAVATALRRAVRSPTSASGAAVITDDAHRIPAAVQIVDDACREPRAIEALTAERHRAAFFFRHTWLSWGASFVEMRTMCPLAEQKHALRLADADRLRLVEPLDPLDAAALQSAPALPAFVGDAVTRDRVVAMVGTMLRPLVTASQLLPLNRRPTQAELCALASAVLAPMIASCTRWLANLRFPAERDHAAADLMHFLSGRSYRHSDAVHNPALACGASRHNGLLELKSPYVRPVSQLGLQQ